MSADDRDPPSEPPSAERAVSAMPPDPEERERRTRRLERIVPDLIKRGIEKGIEAGFETFAKTDGFRGAAVELPKEIAVHVLGAIDETKNGMVRVVAREVRQFLDATDLAKEIQKALTSLSFEIRTEVRFVPNERGELKPKVEANATAKRNEDRKSADESSSLPGADDDPPPRKR